jgi:hypothetical protein
MFEIVRQSRLRLSPHLLSGPLLEAAELLVHIHVEMWLVSWAEREW